MKTKIDLGVATRMPVRFSCSYSFKCHREPSLPPPPLEPHPRHVCLYVALNFRTIHEQVLELPLLEYTCEIEFGGLVTGVNEVRVGFAALDCQVDLNKRALFGFGNYRIASDGFDRSDTIIPKYATGWEFHTVDLKFEWEPK